MRNVAKRLKFPLLGVAKHRSYQDTTYPTETGEYATPMAKNVIGSCIFEDRNRGGSRPGLKAVPQGADVAETHPDEIIYRDRLVKWDGSVWMISRTGKHDDFDFGADAGDVTRAVAGNIALAGMAGESITSAMPINDRALFIATRRAIRMVQGEPTSAVTQISSSVGVISRDAWCFDGMRVFFLGANGLYAMGVGEYPISISQQLPDDLRGIGSACLIYDPERIGIHIIADKCYFYEIETKAFWPIEYNENLKPTNGGEAVIDLVNAAVFNCNGAWYYWDDDTDKDGGLYDIRSLVVIGPFRCGTRDDTDGMLDAITATIATASSDVNISVNVAHSAEDAVSLAEGCDCSFSVGDGWNAVFRPRKRGAWCTLVLSSNGRWAYESILANIKTLGRLRP